MPPQQTEQIQDVVSTHQKPSTLESSDGHLGKMYGKREAIEWMLANRGEAQKEAYRRELQSILDEIALLGGSEGGFLAYKKNKVLH